MKSKLKEFANETTCHGLRNIGDGRRSICVRCSWLLVVLSMFGGLAYTLTTSYLAYKQYRVLTVTKTEPRKTIHLPAVTICNRGVYSNHSGYITGDFQRYVNNAGTVNWEADYGKRLANLSVVEFEEKAAFNWTQLIPFAKIGYKPLNIRDKDLFANFPSDVGRCVIINGPNSIRKHGRFSVAASGRRASLFLFMNTMQYDYININELDAGFEVFIHEPYDTPNVLEGGILLSPGTFNTISIKPVEYRLLPFPYPYHEGEYCIENSDEQIQKINQKHQLEEYSRITCLRDCIANLTVTFCGCNSPMEYGGVRFFKNRRSCTLYEIHNCYIPQMYKFGGKNDELCNCPQPCRYIKYETQVSHSVFPSDPGVKVIQKGASITKEEARESLLKLSIFPRDMLYTELRHVPEINSDSIFGSVGGQMGLFLGASLISMCELFVIFFEILWTYLKRLNGKLKEPANINSVKK